MTLGKAISNVLSSRFARGRWGDWKLVCGLGEAKQ